MSTPAPSAQLGVRPDTAGPTSAADFWLWKACAWAGPVYIIGILISWAGVAGFVPPPGEDWGPQKIAAFYADNEVAIRLGMEGVLFFAMFYFIWSLAIARVMRRAEGRERILSTIQLIGGVSTAWITAGCALLWLTASFRAHSRPPEGTALLNDLAWMVFDMTAMATFFQMVAYGALILVDRREKPLMPRWLAYLTFWLAASLFAVFFMPSFHTGPFSWQGLITLYIALGAFFVWTIAASWYTIVAIHRIERDEHATISGSSE